MKAPFALPAPARPRGVLAAATALATLLTLTGCTTNRQVDFSPSTGRPTVTVTVTVTATPGTADPSASTSGPASLTGGPASSPTGLPSTPAATPTAATFNRTLAGQQYTALIAGIAMIDGQFASGASPALRLDVLSKGFGTLFTLGVPPGLDGPSYLSRLRTLEMFAAAAAQESMTNRQRASDRYQVVRRETGLLLTQVNGALGTSYALPGPLKPSTSLTTPPPR